MYERIREEVAQAIHDTEYPNHPWKRWEKLASKTRYLKMADAALKTDGIEIRSKDQSLPSVRNAVNKSYNDYMLGQEDMLTPDSEGKVWRKVIPKGR